MTILHVITRNELGGAQTVVALLVNSLSKWHRVIVVAGEGDGRLFEQLDSNVETIECKHLKREITVINDMLAIRELIKTWKKYQPDIIHLHSSKAGLLGRIAFPKRKIIYTVHGFDSIRVAYRQFLPLERVMQYFCQRIVSVSIYDKNNLLKEGIRHNVTCIFNGIEMPRDEGLIFSGIPKHLQKKVLCIARLSPPKMADLFMEVAKLMPTVAFIWIGNKEVVNECPNNVFFLGSLPKAYRYCYDADLFLLPSRYEGLPIVILEAMSYGKPVVASNVGGVSELVRNGVNGYAVNNTVNDFVEKIGMILQDEKLAKAMSKESRRIIIEEFSGSIMIESYLKLYKEIYESNR